MYYSDLNKHFRSQSTEIKRILKEFNKPLRENIFFINKKLLYDNPKLVLFNNSRWKQKPDLFCNDVYQEPFYFPIVLFANNIGSFLEFLPQNFYRETIIVPRKEIIRDVLSIGYY